MEIVVLGMLLVAVSVSSYYMGRWHGDRDSVNVYLEGVREGRARELRAGIKSFEAAGFQHVDVVTDPGKQAALVTKNFVGAGWKHAPWVTR